MLASARRALRDLAAFGQPVPEATLEAVQAAADQPNADRLREVEALVAPYVLVDATIDVSGAITLTQPIAPARLVQAGWVAYLLRVQDSAPQPRSLVFTGGGSVTSELQARGMVARPALVDRVEHASMIRDRWWVDFRLAGEKRVYGESGLLREVPLSGIDIEYLLISVYSRDAGTKSAPVSLSVADPEYKEPWGKSWQQVQRRSVVESGIGSALLRFESESSRDVVFDLRDQDGSTCTAAVTVRDEQDRVYPARALRLAPDMPFHDHVYRAAGERIRLPAGPYRITASRGPEYSESVLETAIDDTTESVRLQLTRWVDPAARGYYAGDPHIHGGGCSHYSLPTEGVTPETMIRHARGEGLWVSSVLSWGPCYYHQKQFFTGESISPPSSLEHPAHQEAQGVSWQAVHADRDADSALHYDVEVSGFPSSHSGHVMLLGLRDQDYPGTSVIEDWPSWNLPVHRWAREQGALTGFAHCGLGLGSPTDELPNFAIPAFDSIGANELVVDVPLDAADFLAGGQVSVAMEANVWYHLLNTGYRTLMLGETDYPCLSDDRPGVGRTYVRLPSAPTGADALRSWLAGLRDGASYFGDGRSHLFDVQLDGDPTRNQRREGPTGVSITATVAALLPAVRPEPDVPGFSYDAPKQDWNLEWARIEGTNRVPVEVVVNGHPVGTTTIVADGTPQEVGFDVRLERSSWIALRILHSVHSQPIFVEVGGRPIRASRRSAKWLADCVEALWQTKNGFLREREKDDARSAYTAARDIYLQRAAESEDDR